MMELSLFLSQKKATILKVKHKKKILSLPCLFFFLSCSGLPRTSNRSVTLSVWPEYPEIPGTRCACPRMTEEKIILSSPYFYSFLVIPVFFSSPLSFPCLARESKRDVRLKAEHDKLLPAWPQHRLRHEPLSKRVAFCVHIVSKCLVFVDVRV